jgi:hypothetical protein
MQKKIKKIFNLVLVFIILITPNMILAQDDIVNKECKLFDEVEYFPIGDERGNSVLTKKELKRECNVTLETDGRCIRWEEKDVKYNIDPSKYNTFKSNNYNGALGSVLAAIGAYDQIGHLWSGWKGYCVIGTKYDFSWAKDPMFWASLVMSTVMEGSEEGGFLDGTDVADSVNDMYSSVGNAWEDLAKSIGFDNIPEAFGKCLVAAGVDMGKNVYEYFTDNDDKDDCDPVDEFCDEDTKELEEDSVITLSEEDYNDLLAQNPEYEKYLVIIKTEDGILTLRFKKPHELPDIDKKSQEEIEKAKKKLKKMKFMISTGITAIKMAACGFTGGSIGGNADYGTTNVGNRFSLKDGIGMGINALPADWLGPYGALIKGALKVVLEFLNSFKDLDTCHNEKDAKEEGSRHLKTYESLPYNLCVFTKKDCAQKEFFGGGCGLDAYHYCCYDQILTKILVAQIKAQLGRDWAHCTGITLRDLNFVSFRQCTQDDMKAGFDGTKIVLKYDEDDELVSPSGWTDAKWLESFQHKRKCIDLTEFKEQLEATLNQDIDWTDFDRIFEDVNTIDNTYYDEKAAERNGE